MLRADLRYRVELCRGHCLYDLAGVCLSLSSSGVIAKYVQRMSARDVQWFSGLLTVFQDVCYKAEYKFQAGTWYSVEIPESLYIPAGRQCQSVPRV